MNGIQNPSTNELPTFVITMLGGSGVGKTVFMACMYNALSARNDLSIEADPDLDSELRDMYRKILTGELPEGNIELPFQYDFDLLVDKHPVAKIDWIDYRGGAVFDKKAVVDAGKLHERIKESHAVIVMLDLSAGVLGTYSPGEVLASDHIQIGRYKTLINRQNSDRKIRSVIFVRTKSDLVLDASGKQDIAKACDELVDQLKDNVTFRHVPVAAAIATSSCKITEDSGTKTVVPSEPVNTEWVLFIALKDLLSDMETSAEVEIQELRSELRRTEEEKMDVKKIPVTFWEGFAFWKEDKSDAEELRLSIKASELVSQINEKQVEISKLGMILEKIKQKIPTDQVKIFPNDTDD